MNDPAKLGCSRRAMEAGRRNSARTPATFEDRVQPIVLRGRNLFIRSLLVASGILATSCDSSFGFNIAAWPGEDASVWVPPLNLTNVLAVSGGDGYAMALRVDGTAVYWRSSSYGESGLTNIVGIASGWCHDLALKSDGSVAELGGGSTCWGSGSYTTIPSGLSDATAIAAGLRHSLVLKADGMCVSWGWMSVGSGTAYVPDGLSNVVAVAAGMDMSAALKSDGTLVNWGFADSGGTSGNGLTGISAIAASALAQ